MLRIALLGYGTVGQSVAALRAAAAESNCGTFCVVPAKRRRL